jgi:uncharacterized integral membrane protein
MNGLKALIGGAVRLLGVIWWLLVGLLLLKFYLDNTATAPLVLGPWRFEAVAVPTLVLGSLLITSAIWALVVLPRHWWLQKRLARQLRAEPLNRH